MKSSWKEFEAIYKRVTTPDVAGLTGRFLLADVDNKDAGHSMSMWDSLEAMRAYEESDLLKKVIEPTLRPFYTDDYKTFVSEIVLQRYTDRSEMFSRLRPYRGVLDAEESVSF